MFAITLECFKPPKSCFSLYFMVLRPHLGRFLGFFWPLGARWELGRLSNIFEKNQKNEKKFLLKIIIYV